MHVMAEWLILHTVSAALLAVLILALGRILRLGPPARHALWLLLLVKLLLPPLVSWPWALPLHLGPPADHPAEATPGPEISALEDGPVALVLEEPAAFTRIPRREEPDPPAVPWGFLLGLGWLAGGVALAGRELFHAWRLRGLLADARPAPAWVEEEVRHLAGRLGVRPPGMAVLPGLGSPVIWAGGRARLLWPAGLEGRLNAEGLRAVLVHWVGWLVLVAGWLWWWHPLYWLARRRLGREAELSCDAWVMRFLPGARRAYAEALLEVCQRQSWKAAPALGVAGRRRELERRLRMVLSEHVPCRMSRRVAVGLGTLALLSLPAWSLGGSDRPAPTAKPTAPAVDYFSYSVADDPKPTVSDRDKKVQELEARIKQLLEEVQALRDARKPAATKTTAPTTYQYTPTITGYNQLYLYSRKAANEVTLSRATYKLPADKAKALAAFLSEEVKVSVLETKVDGDSLIVTTTPQVQQVIRQFVSLVQGDKGQVKTGTYQFHLTPTKR
jgi:hypothetical protein